jgi:predicted ATPase
VGRAAELATFARALDQARQGAPEVLLVAGDAGMGKSTLLQRAVAQGEVSSYIGRCIHIGGEVVPFAPLVDLLRQVNRSSPQLLQELGSLGRLVAGALGRDAETGVSLFVGVLDMIGRLADGGTVLVGFEDLHWADPGSWDLFEFLARSLVDERAVLVGTFRADEVARDPAERRRLAELTRLPAVSRLHLGGLTRAEVADQVAALMGGTLPAGVVDEVVARGQGNPFFTEELIAARAAGQTVPALLADLIAADVAALGSDPKAVLAAVAVVGRDTSDELLAILYDGSDETRGEAVRAAMDAQLLVADRASDAYRFRHPLIAEVVYTDLTPTDRRRLHGRVADALRDQPNLALTPTDVAGELASHLERASDLHGSFQASLAAADAAAGFAPGPALGHLERALRLWDQVGPSDESRGQRMWQAAELASATGDNEQAVARAQAAAVIMPTQPAPHSATSAWAATCGRPADWRRARSSTSGPPRWSLPRVRTRPRRPPSLAWPRRT